MSRIVKIRIVSLTLCVVLLAVGFWLIATGSNQIGFTLFALGFVASIAAGYPYSREAEGQ